MNILKAICVVVLFMPFLVKANIEIGSRLGKETKKVVEGYGEHILRENQSREEGFDIAIKLAKLDASRKIGQYMEVVTLQDDKTGDVKEYVASVSALNMKHIELGRDVNLIGNDIVVSVRLTVEYSPNDLKLSLDRFFENRELKDGIKTLVGEIDTLKTAVVQKDIILNELKKQNAILDEKLKDGANAGNDQKLIIAALRKQLFSLSATVEEKMSLTQKAIAVVQEKVHFESKESLISKLEAEKAELNKAEEIYVGRLEEVIEALSYDVNIVKKLDPISSVLRVTIRTPFEIPEDKLALLFRDTPWGFKIPEYDLRPRKDKFTAGGIFSGDEGLARLLYSVYLVQEVNGERNEMPIIAPVYTSKPKSYDNTGYCRFASINTTAKIGGRLCINFKQKYTFPDGVMTIDENKYGKNGSHTFVVGVDTDLKIRTFIEVRRIVGNEVKSYEIENTVH